MDYFRAVRDGCFYRDSAPNSRLEERIRSGNQITIHSQYIRLTSGRKYRCTGRGRTSR